MLTRRNDCLAQRSCRALSRLVHEEFVEPCPQHDDGNIHLMFRISRGDRQAFGQIYSKYYPVVKDYLSSLKCPGHSLNDISQEVFTRLWKYHKCFRGNSAVKTYLFGIAKHIWSDKQGRDHLAKHFYLNRSPSSPLVTPSPFWALGAEKERRELIEAIEEVLARLPSGMQEAVRLVHLLGNSKKKAAKLAGCSDETFRRKLRRGMERLRELLDQENILQA